MNHLDLFSGIGGFSLAAKWVWGKDHNIHSFVEIDPFCQKVLKKHWPDVPIISDIKEYKHDGAAIDLLTGGFPCQPFSIAGKRRGTEDDRSLWHEMYRIIKETEPTWIIGENVVGFVNMELDKTISDLERLGYEVGALEIPACSLEAIHGRERIWIIANNESQLCMALEVQPIKLAKNITETQKNWCEFWYVNRGSNNIIFRKEDEARICRMDDGLSEDMDRLKSLGNAIVPQVVMPIMQAIKEIELSKATNNPPNL